MLNKEQIRQLIEKEKLIEGYIDLAQQLTPNGFDLTVAEISGFVSSGALDFSNKQRQLPDTEMLMPEEINSQEKYGWWKLKKGAYKVKTNETVNLPNNLIALAFSRTSLLRMGAFTQHGVWDAGFKGRGEFILVVENPQGLKIKQNARLSQLVFLAVEETEGYQGIYKDLK
ncbi:MAG: deoxyuridine 5'-triphosphate nucleotidohydrolase [Candidatus Omnitrophica bacterium]|nr:deoxyuridine 5'-triphosphate nucleotidohydrolase [Candidatus Omnitrophota bacterium]MBU2043862.1 deoxyuridine 5'-triphosphate nucleotidohydrolase [Candidatus Omnitrophota bacterium]MBU2265631.1 deoxyuridine 5'-triphosphate nucleotidohydrolase [Candidatus Omnitrophota bacterium]MBU2473211.1 deoxyuridine 5'-triphosphate nucleotidohydrolase [Candidatus Omnitrophota bacterium]